MTTDELPIPANLRCMEAPHGLSVTWDVVTDGNYSCARRSIVYIITVVGEVNRTVISVNGVEQTYCYAEITGSLLEPSQNYTVYIGARLAQGTCETREAATVTVVCRTSDDLSTTAPPGSYFKFYHNH